MAKQLVHRGPDDEGIAVDPARRVALAHRRLAIIDLSPAGAQPMRSKSGRWTIVFNGEIYNHRLIRHELTGHGVNFSGHSDTETLVEAIDRWGFTEALVHTNGMFALAAWDGHEQRLLLARDRLGEKPLYWWNHGGQFAFASELRALRAIPGIDLNIDSNSAAALLRWSFVPHPHTIYKGVRQLAPGHLLDVEFNQGTIAVRERPWWSLGDSIDLAVADRVPTNLDAAAEELEQLLGDAVRMRLESDVPLGAFISGGIDSSLIAGLAARATTGTLRTFTVSMPHNSHDESTHAARVARHLETDHKIVDLSATDVFGLIPELARIWDEPFADPSMLPTALLCRAARRHLTVCIGGDGGDELFAGYNRHTMGAAIHRSSERLPGLARRALATALLAPSPRSIDAFANTTSRILPPSRRIPNMGDKVQKVGALLRAEGSAWETLAQIWPPHDLGVKPHGPFVPELIHQIDPVEGMMLADTGAVLPDQMLAKVDRASMAASLEVRVPFLDHRLLEWSWRQPTEIKTTGGVGKLVLRRLAERVLPSDIVNRPKMGFDPPLAGWLRNELRPWAADLLAAPRSVEHGWIDSAALQQTWREHLAGSRNWDYRLWAVLMLESWLAEYHPK